MEPKFFATPEKFRAWLAAHHASAKDLLVGFRKTSTGKASITWPQSVDEALCFGWIDGVRKRVDDASYTIRFTPRRPTSKWSSINVAKIAELTRLGRMHPAGLAAFEKRSADKTGTYSYEQRYEAKLEPALAKQLRASKQAWTFFSAQATYYQHTLIFWIASAKLPATRAKRLAKLIAESELGRKLL
jgi:uncharacterized protein YdeI (YjbR/CyaY-like superfamily)